MAGVAMVEAPDSVAGGLPDRCLERARAEMKQDVQLRIDDLTGCRGLPRQGAIDSLGQAQL